MVNAHLWSDGCAGQFKNKDQFYWLTTGFQAYGIRLVHNFFQSCHGKGPSDSEGAVVKTGVRKHEFHRGTYVADTEAAFNLLSEHYTKVAHEPSPAEVARKERHTIASRTFHLVPDDRVDHARKTVVTPISGSSFRFCFDGLKGPSANDVSGSDATLVYSELSHYFTASQGHCQACFVGHPEGCTADPAVDGRHPRGAQRRVPLQVHHGPHQGYQAPARPRQRPASRGGRTAGAARPPRATGCSST